MNKEKAILNYFVAIYTFKKWMELGIIDEEEFSIIKALIADKYEISISSIYR